MSLAPQHQPGDSGLSSRLPPPAPPDSCGAANLSVLAATPAEPRLCSRCTNGNTMNLSGRRQSRVCWLIRCRPLGSRIPHGFDYKVELLSSRLSRPIAVGPDRSQFRTWSLAEISGVSSLLFFTRGRYSQLAGVACNPQ